MLSTAPRLTRAGFVTADAASGSVLRVIPMQINPTRLSRTLSPRGPGESADRANSLRLTGPAVETLTAEAVLDATDLLGDGDPLAGQTGVATQLAALELLLSPSSQQLASADRDAGLGVLEILPMGQPLTLFVWGRNRILPVRLTDLSIREDAFDPALNPIRATVSLTMRVLSTHDLGFAARGGQVWFQHLVTKEALARRQPTSGVDVLGIGALP